MPYFLSQDPILKHFSILVNRTILEYGILKQKFRFKKIFYRGENKFVYQVNMLFSVGERTCKKITGKMFTNKISLL